jgi:Ca2+-transporting ATPase
MMSTLHKTPEGGILQFTKGAPDQVLERCTSYYENGQELPLTAEKRREILEANKSMADQALRVLLAAQRRWEAMPKDLEPENLERELCYLGLSGMIDPIRPEVQAAIGDCKRAGIRPIMITGDHRDTAVAIARSLGILDEGQRAITGMELNELSDQELLDHIEEFSVYARVQPEHKVRIVRAWKQKGYITAMTGDGVNDAPSIKAADIGVGMGITGTDVTKNVADMVLADDNFATIVSAVAEGRRIYDNIRKAIGFLLASNLAEVLSIFLATLLGFTILEPVHLLWINLITDCFPALALGLERGEKDIMERQPRSASEGVFAGGLGLDVALQGLVVTAITLASYFLGHYLEAGAFEIVDSPDGMTMAFLTLSMIEIFHSFNMRSRRKSLFSLKSHNGWLWGAMVLSLVLTTLVIYVPFLSTAFGFQEISLMEYAVALGLAVSIIPIMELAKLVLRKLGK